MAQVQVPLKNLVHGLCFNVAQLGFEKVSTHISGSTTTPVGLEPTTFECLLLLFTRSPTRYPLRHGALCSTILWSILFELPEGKCVSLSHLQYDINYLLEGQKPCRL